MKYFVGDLDRIPPDMANFKSFGLLVLEGNNISKIEYISGLKKLKELTISRSKLTKISGLTDLPSLEYLRLSANSITKIENIKSLPNLTFLGMVSSALDEYDLSEVEGVKASISLFFTPYRERIEKEDPDLFMMLLLRDQI